MDIEENLKRQREIVSIINDIDALEMLDDSGQADLGAELMELVDAMHRWFDNQGFLPAAWKGCA